ncbi:MAG: 16S rRNA (adenine(1518)-N(6)/adenine(1519)-N(6))-dimethyltransferase RsmA [Candidatus Paceibacterota bacterium]
MPLQAKKSLGQHFLNSKHVLEQIISAAEIKKGEIVVEIGPGTGILTRALLEREAKVIAIEKDSRINLSLLQESNNLTLINEDVLEADLNFIISASIPPSSDKSPANYALVANIPYYITGAILEKFLAHEPRPNRMVLLVQKEVADRIVARDRKESILSISVKAFGSPRIIAKVPPGAFTPPPSVDSAILAIDNISDTHFQTNNLDIDAFFAIVKAGFAHKRKFTVRNLESVLKPEKISEIWQKLALDPKVRAEDLTLDNWLEIAKHCPQKKP